MPLISKIASVHSWWCMDLTKTIQYYHKPFKMIVVNSQQPSIAKDSWIREWIFESFITWRIHKEKILRWIFSRNSIQLFSIGCRCRLFQLPTQLIAAQGLNPGPYGFQLNVQSKRIPIDHDRYPIQVASMYGLLTYIYHTKSTIHVGKYTLHGSYGYGSFRW